MTALQGQPLLADHELHMPSQRLARCKSKMRLSCLYLCSRVRLYQLVFWEGCQGMLMKMTSWQICRVSSISSAISRSGRRQRQASTPPETDSSDVVLRSGLSSMQSLAGWARNIAASDQARSSVTRLVSQTFCKQSSCDASASLAWRNFSSLLTRPNLPLAHHTRHEVQQLISLRECLGKVLDFPTALLIRATCRLRLNLFALRTTNVR